MPDLSSVLLLSAEVLCVPFGLIRTNLACHANTAGATIPLLLDQVHSAEPFRPGELILFAAVGAGWTWNITREVSANLGYTFRWEREDDGATSHRVFLTFRHGFTLLP